MASLFASSAASVTLVSSFVERLGRQNTDVEVLLSLGKLLRNLLEEPVQCDLPRANLEEAEPELGRIDLELDGLTQDILENDVSERRVATCRNKPGSS